MSYEKKDNFKHYLEGKEEVVDVFFLVLVSIFAITLVYQVTFIQSNVTEIHQLGTMAMGLAVMTVVGISLVGLLASAKIVKFKNLKRREQKDFTKNRIVRPPIPSFSYIIKEDENFASDYSNIFLVALIIQIGFSFVYGGFTGSVFELSFRWDLNTLLLTINAAVAEELFFCLFLAAMMLSLSTKKWHVIAAGIVNVFGFILVHMIVYGTRPDAALYIVFLRVLYFSIYYKTRRVSIPILLHCLNNFLFVRTILFI